MPLKVLSNTHMLDMMLMLVMIIMMITWDILTSGS